MSPIEQNEIIERSQTLEIIAQNYKYRLKELQSQIDSLNHHMQQARKFVEQIDARFDAAIAPASEVFQSKLLLLDAESRLISFKSELEREKGYQELIKKYCKKKTN